MLSAVYYTCSYNMGDLVHMHRVKYMTLYRKGLGIKIYVDSKMVLSLVIKTSLWCSVAGPRLARFKQALRLQWDKVCVRVGGLVRNTG